MFTPPESERTAENIELEVRLKREWRRANNFNANFDCCGNCKNSFTDEDGTYCTEMQRLTFISLCFCNVSKGSLCRLFNVKI